MVDESRKVAFLRGVNVGGKNKMQMKALCEVFAAAGCLDNESYIQSGNVVFRSARPDPELQTVLAKAIEERFGFVVPVVVRSAAELRLALERNPFPGVAEERGAVMFLRDRPAAELLARLEEQRFLPERFVPVGGEIYLDMPDGAGRSRLTTSYFDGRLQTIGTVRNLRTIQRLLEMALG